MRQLLLYPFSLLYGLIMAVRNWMYDFKLLKSRDFDLPIISIGNITMGGTGKTPHTEYLIKLLKAQFGVATLSRGYKRKTQGFRLVETYSMVSECGDEPLMMKKKFQSVTVSVCENRVTGVEKLLELPNPPDVVLLDDAFQHRRINAGLNILLIDFNEPIKDDLILPAGRLRESKTQTKRANIIIITKCPPEITPINRRIIDKDVHLFPYQNLFFTTMVYGQLWPAFTEAPKLDLFFDTRQTAILVITGIASPEHIVSHLSKISNEVDTAVFPDHHNFTDADIKTIGEKFRNLKNTKKIIVTTEKDLVRLQMINDLPHEIKEVLYFLPIQVRFLDREGKLFDKKIIDYVAENKSNRELHLRKNKNKG